MKLNENYVLKTVAGSPVVVPVGDAVNNIHGMITLNAPAELIWKALEAGKDYDAVLCELKATYDVDEKTLKEDLDYFLGKLKDNKILEN